MQRWIIARRRTEQVTDLAHCLNKKSYVCVIYSAQLQVYRFKMLPPPSCFLPEKNHFQLAFLVHSSLTLCGLQGRESADLLEGLAEALDTVAAAADDQEPEGAGDTVLVESTQKSRVAVLTQVHPHLSQSFL
jgi:hypothetical protein